MAGEHGAEVLDVLDVERNGATLGGRDFKNQVEDFGLQFRGIARGVHDAADFEQGIQVLRETRSLREFAQYAIGLQVDGVLRPELDGGASGRSTNSTGRERVRPSLR